MTSENLPGAKARIGAAGLAFLAITSIGWGFNWPATKYLIGFIPPLTLRGSTGVVGAALLAIVALVSGQSLRVPREYLRVGSPQEFDGVDVLAPAVTIRDPAAGRAAVVEVEHRGHRIDAQPINGVTV